MQARHPLTAARRALAPISALLLAAPAACSGDGAGTSASWRTTTATAGDTTIVRTEGAAADAGLRTLTPIFAVGNVDGPDEYSFGSISEFRRGPDGTIWIFDSQARALRVYDSSGTFLRTVGRRGSGPGEYDRANGLAILADGKAILWDANSSRLRVYASAGDPVADWVVPGDGSFHTSGAVFSDTAGFGYVRSRVGDPPKGDDPSLGFMFGITGLLRYGPDGSITDSLVPPTFGLVTQNLVASVKGNTSASPIPFAPRELWAWSPLGYFVAGRGDIYAVHLVHPNGKVTRIERGIEAIPVPGDDWNDRVERATESMRQTDPNWRWTGPTQPGNKPYFVSLSVGNDGRVWVQLSTPSEMIPEEERPTRVPPEGGPAKPYGPRYRESLLYDVFAPDGHFLARVAVPTRTSLRAMAGDFVWAVTRDSNDVQQLAKFRITPPLGAESNEGR